MQTELFCRCFFTLKTFITQLLLLPISHRKHNAIITAVGIISSRSDLNISGTNGTRESGLSELQEEKFNAIVWKTPRSATKKSDRSCSMCDKTQVIIESLLY